MSVELGKAPVTKYIWVRMHENREYLDLSDDIS